MESHSAQANRASDQPPGTTGAWKIGLLELFYAIAVFASSIATFGPVGAFVAATVLLVWWLLFRRVMSSATLLMLLLLVLLFFLLTPAVRASRAYSRSNACLNYLKQLSLALHNHDDTYGSLPAHALCAPDGHPLLSWRAAVLPFIESRDVYEQLALDEPWDSATNQSVLTTSDLWLSCPSHWLGSTNTNAYFAVIDDETVWRPGLPRSLTKAEDIPDGLANTVLLIEASPKAPWTKPVDLTFEEAVRLLTSPIDPPNNGGHTLDHGFFYHPTPVRNIAWADGSVSSLTQTLSVDLARAILTADGGEEINPLDIERVITPRLNIGRCINLGIFVVLCLAPTVPYIRERAGGRGRSEAEPPANE